MAVTQRSGSRLGGYALLHPAARRTSAISAEARTLRVAAREVLESGERSFALFGKKGDAISKIWALVNESREAADGSDVPISSYAAEQAVDFIRALPEDAPLPEYAWEPDGSISLDWIRSRHRVFSLSVGESPRLPYAWLDGSDRGHAVAYFDGETVPPRILEGIRGIIRRAHAPIWTA